MGLFLMGKIPFILSNDLHRYIFNIKLKLEAFKLLFTAMSLKYDRLFVVSIDTNQMLDGFKYCVSMVLSVLTSSCLSCAKDLQRKEDEPRCPVI